MGPSPCCLCEEAVSVCAQELSTEKALRRDCSVVASAGTGQGALADGPPCGERELLVCAWRSPFTSDGLEGKVPEGTCAWQCWANRLRCTWSGELANGGSLNCLNTEFVII